jgi:threonine dehydratase
MVGRGQMHLVAPATDRYKCGMNSRSPSAQGVRAAAERIAPYVIRTPLLPLDWAGGQVWVKAECLQLGGSFKLRGATNRLLLLSEAERARGVVAFSSGNHAQGVAIAAARLGISATIVMPADAPAVKREATLVQGARIVDYDRATESREAIGARLAAESGATLVPSFDDVDVIEGQGSVGVEVAEQLGDFPDRVLVPCGGGGLSAGIALALPEAEIVPVEPIGWDDMRRSLEIGRIVPVAEPAPATRCDALQTKLVSPLTFDALSGRRARGVSVSEGEAAAAMAFAARHLRLVAEPGGAVALAALLAGKAGPATARTVVVVSGGNVDPLVYAEILRDQAVPAAR